MDDGSIRVFQGYRVRNDAGTNGGIRFHPGETVDTIKALPMLMTWKCALETFHRWKGGVVVDPASLSNGEKELYPKEKKHRTFGRYTCS